jgi:hypothetical protein
MDRLFSLIEAFVAARRRKLPEAQYQADRLLANQSRHNEDIDRIALRGITDLSKLLWPR